MNDEVDFAAFEDESKESKYLSVLIEMLNCLPEGQTKQFEDLLAKAKELIAVMAMNRINGLFDVSEDDIAVPRGNMTPSSSSVEPSAELKALVIESISLIRDRLIEQGLNDYADKMLAMLETAGISLSELLQAPDPAAMAKPKRAKKVKPLIKLSSKPVAVSSVNGKQSRRASVVPADKKGGRTSVGPATELKKSPRPKASLATRYQEVHKRRESQQYTIQLPKRGFEETKKNLNSAEVEDALGNDVTTRFIGSNIACNLLLHNQLRPPSLLPKQSNLLKPTRYPTYNFPARSSVPNSHDYLKPIHIQTPKSVWWKPLHRHCIQPPSEFRHYDESLEQIVRAVGDKEKKLFEFEEQRIRAAVKLLSRACPDLTNLCGVTKTRE
ncbi:hypothetical protein BC830DRAFT_1084283 [Chytriomyces sp. MP71]|nr:hypothetical protein BC830DRAFT_1084283 [Chytriomyces sp. MP71]